jgi:hypothetical protein
MSTCCTKTNQSIKTSALQWPWILLNASLYAFAIPWMLSAIIHQYFISKDYESTLPGLSDTAARIFFMGAHMGLGLICMVLYPLQFFQCIRRRFPTFHRWSGRISLLAAVFTSLCGMVFICLKRFHLVGGINMGIAFFTSGIVFGSCAIMTGYFARRREIRRHKNWAIRSYSQILASMLYRYFYAVLGGFGVVYSPDESISCDEMDVCDYFLKPFDAIHAWTFFIFPLLFAEAVVYLLRDETKAENVNEMPVSNEGANDTCINEDNTTEQVDDNDEKVQTKTEAIDADNVILASPNEANVLYLNLFGILFGVIFMGSTVFIYVTNALGVNTFSI